MNPKFSILNGQPYISGNALAYMSATLNRCVSTEEAITLAFPDFADKFTTRPVYDMWEAPFGGHVLEFNNSADETWFRLKYG